MFDCCVHLIVKDRERNHSKGSPMDGTPHAVISLTIFHGQHEIHSLL